MPVNPIPQPTKAEDTKAAVDEAVADTRRFIHRHSTLFAFIIVGIIVASALVVTGYSHTDILLLGYWLAGLGLALDYLIRGR